MENFVNKFVSKLGGKLCATATTNMFHEKELIIWRLKELTYPLTKEKLIGIP